jgi:putative flippase GtrA
MFFAFCSILINLGTQFIARISIRNTQLNAIRFYDLELGFILQLILGTATGFIFKFIVDKFVIFKNAYAGISQTAKQIIIYTLFAIITTAIFWGTEILFKIIFEFPNNELLGGLIGLSIGYTTKFFLDKKWVFIVK